MPETFWKLTVAAGLEVKLSLKRWWGGRNVAGRKGTDCRYKVRAL